MAIEIERKFLLVSESWRAQVHDRQRIVQAYLNDPDAVNKGHGRCSVRVRIAGSNANLNIKSRETGARRQEFEYPIPLSDAESLMTLSCGPVIEKIRHYVNHGGHCWEIDEFSGDNAGLVVAEIELDAVDEVFEKPDWLGCEVTEFPRYYNLALSSKPFSTWSAEEKAC
mgnify:CR=1 FL=1